LEARLGEAEGNARRLKKGWSAVAVDADQAIQATAEGSLLTEQMRGVASTLQEAVEAIRGSGETLDRALAHLREEIS
jgi:hypothetical protein